MLMNILRRLVLIALWFTGGSAALLIFVNAFVDTIRGKEEIDYKSLGLSVLILVGTYVCHRLIVTWNQRITPEKNAPPE